MNRCADGGVKNFSEGGCGFLQRCVYFSRSEQSFLAQATATAIAAMLCTTAVVCGVAAAVAFAIVKYFDSHSICPTSKPKLRVQYFPVPQIEGCVS